MQNRKSKPDIASKIAVKIVKTIESRLIFHTNAEKVI